MRDVYIEFMRKQQSRKIRNFRDDLFEQLQRSTLTHKRLEIHIFCAYTHFLLNLFLIVII